METARKNHFFKGRRSSLAISENIKKQIFKNKEEFMHPLKCRFCLFKEDDPERTVNISRGTFKDNDFDLIYDLDNNTFKPAIYESDYVVVTCPNHKCERIYYISKEEIPIYCVRTTQECEDSFGNVPQEESLYLPELTEEGNIMCKHCSHSNEPPDKERKAFVMYQDLYINSLVGEPAVDNCIPNLVISCKNLKCTQAFEIPPKGQTLEGVVEVKPSKLLAKLGVQAGGTLHDVKHMDTKKVIEFVQSPEFTQRMMLESMLSAVMGCRVVVTYSPREDQENKKAS